jgi:hypothetical protein
MVKEDIAYWDMLLLAQFHTNFLTLHFQWHGEEDKIAKNHGFRCWQILAQCYPMQKDLVVLKTRINWNSFGDYGKNLEKLVGQEGGKAEAKE